MFGIGTTELILILVVALLVLGPQRLPEVMKLLGKVLSQFRKITDEVKKEIMDQEELGEIQESLKELGEVPRLMQKQMEKELEEMERLKKENREDESGTEETGEKGEKRED